MVLVEAKTTKSPARRDARAHHGGRKRPQNLQVNLTQPIPVLIVYGTAVVSESGEVSFFDDIYHYDSRSVKCLTHGYPYSG
jgi:murein L,D-transpeptidase YcbB/YkuD